MTGTELRRVTPRTLRIGDWVVRPCATGSVPEAFQVRNIYRRDQQAQLVPDTGGQAITVSFVELRRLYRTAGR
ncbi:MAG: hypothetical protein ACRDLV_16885 [Solirubrobacteraceae bacterium]